MKKPKIFITFVDGGCDWYSDGWAKNDELMKKARSAINEGETPHEVIENLKQTFEVNLLERGGSRGVTDTAN